MSTAEVTENTMSPSKREKFQSLINLSARIINTEGASAISLSRVANEAGLSRNGLYRYVKDRNQLIKNCYQHSCEISRQNLSEALSKEGAKEQLKHFILLELSPSSELAVVNDFEFLPAEHQQEIKSALDSNTTLLTEILTSGQEADLFRDFDCTAVAHSLQGVLDWTILWFNWLNESESTFQEHGLNISENVIDWILHGIAIDKSEFTCHLDCEALTFKHYSQCYRNNSSALRRLHVISQAAKLFNQRGVEGVSLDQIAASFGNTKGVIYHQFKNKKDLLNACYESSIEQHEVYVNAAEKMNCNSLEKLLTLFHLNCQAHLSDSPPLALQFGLTAQPPEILERARKLRDRVKALFIQAGEEGSIRPLESNLVEISAGASFGVRYYLDQQDRSANNRIADQITDVFSKGICK